jgi:hypothetical protein
MSLQPVLAGCQDGDEGGERECERGQGRAGGLAEIHALSDA